MSGTAAVVSILVVSDYGGRTAEDWNYLRETLHALAQQRFDEGVEVILVDATPAGEQMPPDVMAIVPSLRVIGGTETTREALNAAVSAASAYLSRIAHYQLRQFWAAAARSAEYGRVQSRPILQRALRRRSRRQRRGGTSSVRAPLRRALL